MNETSVEIERARSTFNRVGVNLRTRKILLLENIGIHCQANKQLNVNYKWPENFPRGLFDFTIVKWMHIIWH